MIFCSYQAKLTKVKPSQPASQVKLNQAEPHSQSQVKPTNNIKIWNYGMVGMSCHGIAFLLFPFNNDNIKFYHPTKNEHEKIFYNLLLLEKRLLNYKRNNKNTKTLENIVNFSVCGIASASAWHGLAWHASSQEWHPPFSDGMVYMK